MNRKVLVISHRGMPPLAPEHTFEGYDLAIGQHTHYIEQDLQLSVDGELIVSHDKFIDRTTNRYGMIAELTVAEIQKARFSNGEQPHTLEEIFAKYGQSIKYVIETKFDYADKGDYRGEDRFLALIEKYNVRTQVVFQSFHQASLAYPASKMPEVPTLLLVKKTANYGIECTDLSQYPCIDIICFESRILTQYAADQVHAAGKEVFMYFEPGDDTVEQLQQGIAFGIDGVFTDYTARAIQIIGETNYR